MRRQVEPSLRYEGRFVMLAMIAVLGLGIVCFSTLVVSAAAIDPRPLTGAVYVGESYDLEFAPRSAELIYRVGTKRTEVLRLRVASSICSFDPDTYRWADDVAQGVTSFSRVAPEDVSDQGVERWEIGLVADGQPWAERKAVVDLYPDHWELMYAVGAPDNAPVSVQAASYGGLRNSDGDMLGSYFSARRMRYWCSDIEQQYLTTASRVTVELQSSVTPATVTQEPKNDMGRFLIPPYTVAFEAHRDGPWWGVGTLEVPQAATGLEVHVAGKQVYFAISPLGAVKVEAGDWWVTPTLAFFATREGLGEGGAASILTAYREVLFQKGVAHRRSDDASAPSWWFEPMYTTWGDQVYHSRVAVGDDHLCWSFVNERQVDQWIAVLESRGIPVKTVVLDAGWALGSPEWLVDTAKWPDLRGWIERQHAQGRRVLLWIAPYWGSGEFGEPFPGFYLRDLFGGYVQAASFPAPLLDFSNPAVRTWFADRLRYMLSAEPGALNADGLKIDFYYDRPDPRSRPFDRDWGMGEQYSLNTLEWIYQAAKAFNPEALITMSAANPFFNGSNDLVRVNDNWQQGNAFSVWRKRATAVIQAGGNVMDSDDWIGYLQANGETWTQVTAVRAVLAVPTLLTSRYRELNGRYVEPTAAEWSEAAALLQTYRLSPTTYRSRFDVDRPDGTYRRYAGASGELEAMTLPGSSGAVFYHDLGEVEGVQAWDAYVVTLGTGQREVAVPLQPDTRVEGVFCETWPLLDSPSTLSSPSRTVAFALAAVDADGGAQSEEVVRFSAEGSCERSIYRVRMRSDKD